jgi:glycolate oxidase FAD binding subunit
LRRLPVAHAEALWSQIRTAAVLPAGQLWRVHVPPSAACKIVAALEPLGAEWLFDWGGGLVWLSFEGDARLVRDAADAAGGQALLVRAPAPIWTSVPAQHPRPPGVAALEMRVRRAFDPAGVFEAGRFLGETRAD